MAAVGQRNHSLSQEEVTDEDIRVFKTTLLARRFPGLKGLSDKAIKDLIRADRKAALRTLPSRTHPKTQFEPLTRIDPGQTNIFYPVNPSQAKETAKRPDSECFIGIATPYDAHHADFVEDKTSDEARRINKAAFCPTSTSQARDAIRVDYYLNSVDTQTKQAELAETRQRGTEQIQQYLATQTSHRGQMYRSPSAAADPDDQ